MKYRPPLDGNCPCSGRGGARRRAALPAWKRSGDPCSPVRRDGGKKPSPCEHCSPAGTAWVVQGGAIMVALRGAPRRRRFDVGRPPPDAKPGLTVTARVGEVTTSGKL